MWHERGDGSVIGRVGILVRNERLNGSCALCQTVLTASHRRVAVGLLQESNSNVLVALNRLARELRDCFERIVRLDQLTSDILGWR